MLRQYTRSQVQAILQSAAQRQHAVETEGLDRGLTLPEIEELAMAAGLDPVHVSAAASDLLCTLAPPQTLFEHLLGLPRDPVQTIRLAGPVSGAVWERMTGVLRQHFDGYGENHELGARREWTAKAAPWRAPVRVVLDREGSDSRLTITRSFRIEAEAALLCIALCTLGGLALVALLLTGPGAVGLALAVGTASATAMVGLRCWLKAHARTQQRRFAVALDHLAALGTAPVRYTMTRIPDRLRIAA